MRKKTKSLNSKPRTVGIGVGAKSRRCRATQRLVRINVGSKETVTSITGPSDVSCEQSVVATAISNGQRHPVAVGSDALFLAGKMKEKVTLVRPICCGVVVDFEAAEWLIQGVAHKALGGILASSKRSLLKVVLWRDATRTERKTLLRAAYNNMTPYSHLG